jgi:hypothetical protein
LYSDGYFIAITIKITFPSQNQINRRKAIHFD